MFIIGPILIFIVLQYCAQKWAYKCYKELREMNALLEEQIKNTD